MAVRRTINQTELWQIKDHLHNTTGELIKCYTLTQLSLMDGIDVRTIKKSGKYLPVRVDYSQGYGNFRAGKQKYPYRVEYIRLDEIKDMYKKRNKFKKLIEEKE